MALKQRGRVRVRVELPSDIQGKQSVEDELRNQLYKAVSDSLPGLDADIDIEIEKDDSDPVESFRQGWADTMEGRVMSWEEFERRMREDAD